MAEVRDLIRRRLADMGLSMKEASERIGRNHAYLQQYFERGVPASLPEDLREKLGALLQLSPDSLRPGASAASDYFRTPLLAVPPANPADKVPVMGIAEGGDEGWSLWNGDIVDYIQRPPTLSGAPQGYATYVFGTSMEPRYHPGEIIYVHPGRPVTVGSYVLVQVRAKHEGEPPGALVKRLSRRTAQKIVLEQFNPARTFEIPIRDVV